MPGDSYPQGGGGTGNGAVAAYFLEWQVSTEWAIILHAAILAVAWIIVTAIKKVDPKK